MNRKGAESAEQALDRRKPEGELWRDYLLALARL